MQAAKGNALCSLKNSLRTARFARRRRAKHTLFAQGIFRDVHAAAKYGLEFIRAAAAARTL